LDQLILDLNGLLNTSFVLVSHELASIFRIADRVLLLDAAAKTMVALDDPATLRDASPDPRVRAFFNRQANPIREAEGGPHTAEAVPAKVSHEQ
jgi:phospholipid/cholesterol/gamma-HCH transport system ATP-binding protein